MQNHSQLDSNGDYEVHFNLLNRTEIVSDIHSGPLHSPFGQIAGPDHSAGKQDRSHDNHGHSGSGQNSPYDGTVRDAKGGLPRGGQNSPLPGVAKEARWQKDSGQTLSRGNVFDSIEEVSNSASSIASQSPYSVSY